MKKFKELISTRAFNKAFEFPSVSVTHGLFTLNLRFDSKDVLVNSSFEGPFNIWLSSLCLMMEGKTLDEISLFTLDTWKSFFKDDQVFWEILSDEENKFFHRALEMCHASLDIYRGREYLYQDESPLICRCFGIRESDILAHLQSTETPTLDTLAGSSKAGMGCRSCVPQLKRWLVLHETKKHNHFYKERSVAEWLLQIDESLVRFPGSGEWKMEVQKFKGQQVIISFDKEVSQVDTENMGKELQAYLAREVDPDLAFFLSSARHFSKARG